MIISIKEFYEAGCKKTETKVPLVGQKFESMGVGYDYEPETDVTVTVRSEEKGHVSVQMEGKAFFSIPCARCLKPVKTCVELSAADDFSEKTSDDEDSDRSSYLNGYDLDVDRMAYEEILLGFPMKVLCKDDCKGICKVCGADLNEGECGCDRTELDPRMSVIRDIFNNVKEV